jgi:hypothetical protein
VQLPIIGLFRTILSALFWKWLTVLPLLAHHCHRETAPFANWANGIVNAQQ